MLSALQNAHKLFEAMGEVSDSKIWLCGIPLCILQVKPVQDDSARKRDNEKTLYSTSKRQKITSTGPYSSQMKIAGIIWPINIASLATFTPNVQ